MPSNPRLAPMSLLSCPGTIPHPTDTAPHLFLFILFLMFYLYQLELEVAEAGHPLARLEQKSHGRYRMPKALVLGGGAPNLTLMSGALSALIEREVKFDVVSTAGAGTFIGLLYAAPKGDSPLQALKDTINIGISDWIYQFFPVNYKVYQKPGAGAQIYRNLLDQLPWAKAISGLEHPSPLQRLFTDWVQLVLCSFSPSDLTPMSKGLCAHMPFITDWVDFDTLREVDFEFYINAYNITDRHMDIFSKKEITLEHYFACASFPFLYPPKRVNGKLYFEGAAVDCLNYKSLVEKHPEVDTIVVFDVLGSDKLFREPRDLYDAWVLSIITPLVEIARDDTKIFELKYNRGPDGKALRKLLKVEFDIPTEHLPQVLDWSYSNLKTLFDIGYQSGSTFYEEHRRELETR
jgi:predicted acylesterase/phospholipase RssA